MTQATKMPPFKRTLLLSLAKLYNILPKKKKCDALTYAYNQLLRLHATKKYSFLNKEHKNGTSAEKLLYEFSHCQKRINENKLICKLPFLKKVLKCRIEKESSMLYRTMSQINLEYPIQLDMQYSNLFDYEDK